MKRLTYILLLALVSLPLSAQVDKKDVRAGNRRFRRDDFKHSEIDYRKALVKDSTSFAATYDLASSLYRQEDYAGAATVLDKTKEAAVENADGDRYYFNRGDAALQQEDYAAAVDAFKQSLLRNPGDMEAKESYIYAKKKLEDQQNQQNQDQNQNNQDQDQNQNQDQDQNQDNQDKDQNQDQNQDNQNQDQQPQEGRMTPQQAQQLLKAVQAEDRKTQDKVNKEKAAALKSRQKEKNW